MLLTEALAGRSSNDRADVLYLEWRRALDVVYGNLDETGGDLADILRDVYGIRIERPVGEYLFVLHTYFALVARLIAVEILAIAVNDQGWRPSSWSAAPLPKLQEKVDEVEEGRLPGGLSITNLLPALNRMWGCMVRIRGRRGV